MDGHSILRGRRDIAWQEEAHGWLAFDPLTRQSYQCGYAQRWLFEQLDGRQTLSQIHRRWMIRPTQGAVTWPELLALAQGLSERGLVRCINHANGQSSSALHPKRSWLQWFSQSVSWRVRGPDPTVWLEHLAPHTDMFFSPAALRFWLVSATVIGLLVLADFERLLQLATVWQWLMRPASGSALFAIFVITRALHELGHALILTRLGGRCPDIGLIFMLGAPCVYCDVSESWRLPNRWQRAAVAAGGMYAELIVATCAGALWLCTTPGLVNTIALQTMLICSISTWVINANPLMRFDGYYILSDWLGQTNLRGRADLCLTGTIHRLTLGSRQESNRVTAAQGSAPVERWLALFSLTAVLYRFSLSWMMASVIVALYSAWHLAELGRWIAIALLICWWGIPTMKFVNQLWQAASSRWARLRLGLVAAGVVILVGGVPVPYRLHGRGWIQPEQMQALVAPATARLLWVSQVAGSDVSAGQVILRLDDRAEQLNCLELDSLARRTQLQYASLRKRSYFQDELATDLEAVQVKARLAATQLKSARQSQERFEVRALCDGRLVSMPAPPLSDVSNRALVAGPSLWLEPGQAGRLVPGGTMLGAICSRQQLAVIPLADEQLADVVVGTPVRLLMHSLSDQVWHGHVESVVQLNQLDSTTWLLMHAEPAHEQTSTVQAASNPPTGYAAVVRIASDQLPATLPVNATLDATFDAPARSLAAQGMLWCRRNLRWLIVQRQG